MLKTFQVSIGDPWQILIVREAIRVVVLGEVLCSQSIVQIADAAGNVMLTDSRSRVTASLINTPPQSCDDNDNGLIGRPDSSVKINIITEGVAAYQGLTITAASDSLQIRTTHDADAHSALKRCARGLECTQHSVHSKS